MEMSKFSLRSLLVLLLVGLSTSDEVVVNLDGPAKPVVDSASSTVGIVSHSCSADGTSFTCKSSSTHCFNDSPVYCNFSVDLVKEISENFKTYLNLFEIFCLLCTHILSLSQTVDKHDTDIESLTKRLTGLEEQHQSASETATKLREVSFILYCLFGCIVFYIVFTCLENSNRAEEVIKEGFPDGAQSIERVLHGHRQRYLPSCHLRLCGSGLWCSWWFILVQKID